jgi:hypothetical protein
MREHLARRFGVPDSHVLISCTHTHSGPVTAEHLAWRDDPVAAPPEAAYLEMVTARVAEAAVAAQQKARPSRLAWKSVVASGVGGNRHSPDGTTDPEVGLLAIRDAKTDCLAAVAMIYSMHPTVLHEDSTLVSADFPYFARRHVQESLGGNLKVLYFTGPCGNQSPRYFIESQTFAEAERIGRKLGETVVRGLGRDFDQDFSPDCVLGGELEAVELPRRLLPTVGQAEATLAERRGQYEALKHQNGERAKVRTAEVAVFGAEGLLTLARAQQLGVVDRVMETCAPVQVQALRVGEVCVVGFPGEVFVEYGLDLKRRAPVKTFAVAYANGHLHGYIVTPAAAGAGGYEALGRLFEPQAGDIMVNTALSLIPRLFR